MRGGSDDGLPSASTRQNKSVDVVHASNIIELFSRRDVLVLPIATSAVLLGKTVCPERLGSLLPLSTERLSDA